jgi:uncharacterized protein (TIGR02284 family)
MSAGKGFIGVLNDLIRINNDRAEGYKKTIEQLKVTDIDLKTMFSNMAHHSDQFACELKAEVTKLGGEYTDDTTQSGKIYRVWMDVRSKLSAHDRRSIIAMCEFGEDAALKAYNSALESADAMSTEVKQIVVNQHDNIKAAHDVVKRFRDMHEAVNN